MRSRSNAPPSHLQSWQSARDIGNVGSHEASSDQTSNPRAVALHFGNAYVCNLIIRWQEPSTMKSRSAVNKRQQAGRENFHGFL